MQVLTVILTNKSGTSTIQIPYVVTVKLETTDDSVFVLSDSKDDICASVDLSNTPLFLFKSVHSTPSQFPIHVARSPCGLMYKTVVPHILPFQRPLLHPLLSSIGLTMVDAVKLTKTRKNQVRSRIH